MNAEIIAVGTELLLGDIVNTNAQYLSKELAKLGIGVFYQTVVGDNPERILTAFKNAFERADMIITTGGLGPTEDDLTKEMAAKYFNKEMILDEESLELITNFFKKQQFKMTDNNKKQAYIPEGSKILKNEKGTAPGCLIEEDNKIIIMLPGPPNETIPMFENHVKPYLQSKTDGVFYSKTLRVCGVGESMAEDMIKDIIEKQTNPSIAPYAKTFEVHLRITASAKNIDEAKKLVEPVAKEIYGRLGDNVYGEDETSLESCVVELLIKNNISIACAESCTGGMLTAKLVDYPGASKVLKESAITYSNEAKISRLGVKEETLKKYGAVSKEIAIEMAKGIAETSNSDIGVSITGIAGPDGGTKEKPVGLVYIGLYYKGNVYVEELNIVGDRQRVRSRSVVVALDFIRRKIKSES